MRTVFLPNFIKNLDRFGESIPQLNIRSQTVIQTQIGALVTMLIYAITLSYALLQLYKMCNRKGVNTWLPSPVG